MASKKTKWSMDEKIRIVLQTTFNPETKVAELCLRANYESHLRNQSGRAVPRAQPGSQNPVHLRRDP